MTIYYLRASPPDILLEERVTQNFKSFSADHIYEWNIDGQSETSILQILQGTKKHILSFFERTKNITLSKTKGQKTHFSKLRDKNTLSLQNYGPKTHFSKLRDQNMTFSKVKGPKTYFSLRKK